MAPIRLVALVLVAGAACAKVAPARTAGGAGSGGHATGTGGAAGSGSAPRDAGSPPPTLPPPPALTDFPGDPILGSAATPAAAPDLFAGATARAGGAPCLASPQAGTLMPRNWLRPRFE
jgi:hypothetical protein